VSAASYDKGAGMLSWPVTKNGRPHSIPLPPQAVAILDALTPNEHGLYFPHRRHPERPSPGEGFGDIVERFLEDHPEIPRFVPRDMRRTWKTCAGMAGVSKEGRDRIQNHHKSDISSIHYDKYDYIAEKRADMARWASYLDAVLDGTIIDLGQRADNVVPIVAASAG
jgi:integrase